MGTKNAENVEPNICQGLLVESSVVINEPVRALVPTNLM